jgi:PAS domain S-box-containing protein
LGELADDFNQMAATLQTTQKALQENERFLSSIFESIQDGISVIDKEYNVVRVNQAMERWYAQAMPLVGKKCYEAYHGRREPCEICPTRSTIETGLAARDVVIEKGAKGEIVRYVELHTFPMMDDSDRLWPVVFRRPHVHSFVKKYAYSG